MPVDTLTSYKNDLTTTYMPPPAQHTGGVVVASDRERDTLESLQPTTAKSLEQEPYHYLRLIAKGMAIGLAFSACIAGLGALVSWLGTSVVGMASRTGWRLKEVTSLNEALQTVARVLIKTGKGVFLTITVPLYMVFIQFPRWLVKEGLPSLVHLIKPWAIKFHSLVVLIASTLATKAEQLAQLVANQVQSMLQFVSQALEPLKGWVFALSQAIQDGAQRCLDKLKLVTDFVAQGAKACWTVSKNSLLAIGRTMRPYWASLCSEIGRASEWVWHGVQTVWHVAQPFFLWCSQGVTRIAEQTLGLVTGSFKVLQNLTTPVLSWIGDRCAEAAALVGWSINALFDAVKNVAHSGYATGMIKAIAHGFQTAATVGWGALKGVVASLRDAALTVSHEAAHLAKGAVSTLFAAVSLIDPAVQAVLRSVKAVAAAIGKVIPQFTVNLGQSLASATRWLSETAIDGIKTVVTYGTTIIKFVGTAASAVASAIISAFSKLFGLLQRAPKT